MNIETRPAQLSTPIWMLVAVTLVWCILHALEWVWPFASRHDIAAASMVPNGGQAFTVSLASAPAGDVRVALFEGVRLTREPFAFAQPVLGWSRVYYYANGVFRQRFPSMGTATKWRPIGPGESQHDEIRKAGKGRYSWWHGTLYFSASDGSDPRANGRAYRLELERRVPPAVRWAIAGAWTAVALLVAFRVTAHVPLLREHRPGLVITFLMLLGLFAATEAYLRATIPFTERAWQVQMHPRAGKILAPGSEMRHTNDVDFWVSEKANSLGFLDREPAPKAPGAYRVLVLGDSFVEAAQVQMARKFHVLLESHLRRAFPQRRIDVVATGYSATGQAAQLGFYEAFHERLEPDMVIALVIHNDFANNSRVLEAMRQGYHPDHPPWQYFDLDPTSPGTLRRIAPDPDWARHLLLGNRAGGPDDVVSRMRLLRQDPAHAAAMEGWKYPDDLDMDTMFCAADIPPVFQQAVAITNQLFGELRAIARRDGIKVLAVAGDTVTTWCRDQTSPRPTRGDALISRLRAATVAAGIELFDLHPAFAAKGRSGGTTFRFDGHWNEQGHEWAAEALAEYMRTHPELLTPGRAAHRP